MYTMNGAKCIFQTLRELKDPFVQARDVLEE